MKSANIRLSIFILAALAFAPAAQAIIEPTGPFATITVETDGQVSRVPIEIFGTEKGWGWSVSVETDEYEITGEGLLNPDPFIAYGIAVVDIGASSIFGFAFGTRVCDR